MHFYSLLFLIFGYFTFHFGVANIIISKPAELHDPHDPYDQPQRDGHDSRDPHDPVRVALNMHNALRWLHKDTGDVKLDPEISKASQEWADHVASTGKFDHSPGHHYGENLYMHFGGPGDKQEIIRDAITTWYTEVKNYKWEYPGYRNRTGHFSAMVWRATTAIGVGIATHHDLKSGIRSVVVVNYYPPGNVIGGKHGDDYFRGNVTMMRVHDYDYDNVDSNNSNRK